LKKSTARLGLTPASRNASWHLFHKAVQSPSEWWLIISSTFLNSWDHCNMPRIQLWLLAWNWLTVIGLSCTGALTQLVSLLSIHSNDFQNNCKKKFSFTSLPFKISFYCVSWSCNIKPIGVRQSKHVFVCPERRCCVLNYVWLGHFKSAWYIPCLPSSECSSGYHSSWPVSLGLHAQNVGIWLGDSKSAWYDVFTFSVFF
jgi:hypothetical protein